jgi:hypothetical protein
MQRGIWITFVAGVAITCLGAGCRDQYEKLPKASEKDQQALVERYKALVEDAKKLKPDDSFQMLHHFSTAALSKMQPADFTGKASKFIPNAASGKFDQIKIRGARAPGRVRLLLVTVGKEKGNIPFVQSPDGWKIDDVDVAFGDFAKTIDMHGAAPAFPPSPLASLSVLQDPQASTKEKVQAALHLGEGKEKEIADQIAQKEPAPWTKTALLYVSWKAGGNCEAFAQAFPVDKGAQHDLYTNDVDSYRTLVTGLGECAASAKSVAPTVKMYQGCYQADEKDRSVYVEPVVKLAMAKPDFILKAGLQSGYKYESDAVANIAIGALHCENQASFIQYLKTMAGKKDALGKLAKLWQEKKVARDEDEPCNASP